MPEETAATTAATTAETTATAQTAVTAGKDTGKTTDAGKDTKTAAKTSGTVAEGATEDLDNRPASTWPDDWRDRFAGADKNSLKALGRYNSPEGVWQKVKALEKKLTEGGPKKPGEGATEEDVAEYRRLVGLPEKAEAYIEGVALPDGRVLGDDDKPVAESFAKAMHPADLTQAQFNAAIGWYNDHVEKVVADQLEQDGVFKTESDLALREKWGPDYRPNINAISAVFADAPEGLMQSVLGARDATGRKFGDNPMIVEWLSTLGKTINPIASIMPAGQQTGKGVEDEIAGIEAKMNTPEYWRDEKIQARYRDLLDAREKVRSRAA